MRFKADFLRNYLVYAPAPLAIERSLECEILARQSFDGPVLDVGCGDGIFASCLFDEPIDTGIDLNARELQHASRMNAYNELLCCPGSAIPKPDGSFRTAFSNSVLEHIPDLPPVIREVHRLLVDGGRFCVTVPTDHFEQYTFGYQVLSGLAMRGAAAKFRTSFNKFWRHHHCYKPDEWETLFRQNGFRTIERKEYNPKPLCMLNDAMAPLSALSFCVKKCTNRWILLPHLRRMYVGLPHALLRRFTAARLNDRPGGLLFLALEKC